MAYNAEFQKRILEAVGGISDPELERRTGVAKSTFWKMKQGIVPSRTIILRFAQAMGYNLNEWLEAAGYPSIGAPPKPSIDPRIAILARLLNKLLSEKPRRVWFSAKTLRKLEPQEKYNLLRAIEEDKGWELLPKDINWSDLEDVRKREMSG